MLDVDWCKRFDGVIIDLGFCGNVIHIKIIAYNKLNGGY